jgi:hypothetical protein
VTTTAKIYADNLIFRPGSVDYTILHSGNTGSGNGLDADMLDTIHGYQFARQDASFVGTDSDLYFGFGKALLGYNSVSTGSATFSHRTMQNTAGYAVLQNSVGDTVLNAADTRTTYLRNNNNTIASINSTGITLAAGKSLVKESKTGYIFVPYAVDACRDTANNLWDGNFTAAGSAGGTDYDFNMNAAANGSIPAAAVAVVVVTTGKWESWTTSNPRVAILTSSGYFISAWVGNGAGDKTVATQAIVALTPGTIHLRMRVFDKNYQSALVRVIGYFI